MFNGSPSIFRTWIGPSIYVEPWTTWLYYPGFRVLGAPYSIFWIWFYRLIAWDPLFANLFMITVDLLATVLIWRKTGLGFALLYQWFSLYFLLAFPSDMLIFWLAILAYKWRPFLLIAPLVKLPIGAPFWVWQWVFTSPYSVHNPENILRYSLLAVTWTGALLYHLRIKLNRLIFSALDRFH